ncbi:MAG: 2-amino-4-hydroxy-6-hydroxymethyldihydropteridine diphosphokinase [Nitrospirae bacterium]|nr:MAG: 2-amino-4-hydroxy-6-hydroxymethyldihydropteridine diphosphokinase [Nitrospirota bacterium]
MSTAHIGIGSNLGDRQANCLRAIDSLAEHGLAIKKISSFYETEPWGVKDQPSFLNLALEAETFLSPVELLAVIKKIEEGLGRTDAIKWGPRVIDLDILFYDDLILRTGPIEIPHPYLRERDFVLMPLNEIAPAKTDPVSGKTVAELKKELAHAENH